MSMLLAYIPFLTPVAWVHTWWYLLIVPLSFGIAVIYKALRMVDLTHFWRETVVMTVQIVLAMIALAVVLMLLVMEIIPRLPVPS